MLTGWSILHYTVRSSLKRKHINTHTPNKKKKRKKNKEKETTTHPHAHTKKEGVALASNPSTRKAEEEELLEFRVSLGYVVTLSVK